MDRLHRGVIVVLVVDLEQEDKLILRSNKKKYTDPLVDLLVDGRLPAGGTRNFEPFDQRFDGQTLTEETQVPLQVSS